MTFKCISHAARTISIAISFFAYIFTTQTAFSQEAVKKESDTTNSALSITELRTFVEVMEKVKREYVENVTDQKLLENAIKGILSNLDPHSAFYNKEEFEGLTESTNGSFAGLGIEIVNEDGLLRIISPIDDSPAAKAGIKAGDLIIRINDTATQSVSPDDAIKMLRGEPDTKVLLTIIREGAEKPLKIEIVRAIIKTKSVRSEMLETGYGYIRLAQFQERASQEFVDHLKELIQKYQKTLETSTKNPDPKALESTKPLKGLILDLRSNPGGLVNQAVAISDLFINQGLIVYTQGRDESTRSNSISSAGDILKGAPLIVLINSGSASASEIVAGALQDNRRALIVGERSFGKGSVQIVVPLNDGRGLKFTTARYYTPSGKSIQAEGIIPDITIEDFDVKVKPSKFERIREADLIGHLDNKSASKEPSTNGSQGLAEKDYQLYEALNLLKAAANFTEVVTPLNKPTFDIPSKKE